jgi:hypothetical protein
MHGENLEPGHVTESQDMLGTATTIGVVSLWDEPHLRQKAHKPEMPERLDEHRQT